MTLVFSCVLNKSKKADNFKNWKLQLTFTKTILRSIFYMLTVVSYFQVTLQWKLRIPYILEAINILKLQNPEVSSKQAKWYPRGSQHMFPKVNFLSPYHKKQPIK